MTNDKLDNIPQTPKQSGKEYMIGNSSPKEPKIMPIGESQVQHALDILQKYKQGKNDLEKKIIENEQFWKLRHWEQMRKPGAGHNTPATAWLWNVIVSKHADLEDGYPEPNILPREEGDKSEATILSDIVPVIMEQNEFHKIYSDCAWYKLKQGCSVYGIFWDKDKLSGLGDISIQKIDILSLFWEPGITDIQDSENIFHVELIDNDILKSQYPQLTDKVLGADLYTTKYEYDDPVDTSGKSTVIDWYYHRYSGEKKILHYVKFVGNTVLYATENETTPPSAPIKDPITGQPAINPNTGHEITQPIGESMAQTGLYEHGLYPFVFDSLYDIEGSPCGYGFTDICKDTQLSIDQLNSAIVRNALMASKRRYFVSDAANINVNDFADWDKDLVSVSGSLSDEYIREITTQPLSSIYVDILNNQIDMLKETSGNRDVNNGGGQSGVTAASALAVLQEAGNKQSRDIIATTYEAYKSVIYQVIELIRQFYDVQRQYRIVGQHGEEEFVSYDNSGIKAQDQGSDFGADMGYRVPQFDIKVGAQKSSPYNKLSQNELALQFYNLQFFNPQNAQQASSCLDMMDFDGKDELERKISQSGTLQTMFGQLYNLTYQMAAQYNPELLGMLEQVGAQAGIQQPAQQPMTAQAQSKDSKAIETDSAGNIKQDEHPFVQKARQEVQQAAQPN